jgi:LCP family protein required for cell wall assembly
VLVVVLAVALVALYHLGLYFYVDRSIDRVHALATDGPEVLAPQLQADAQNYLVVGTGVPGEHGAASVATLVVSISGDQRRAVLLSVPPTALVDTPECRTRGGALRGPTTEAFAASLLDGGPGCLVRSVQQLSGLRIDHYLGVDLGRLPGMVDALGGVPVCVVPSPALSAAADPLPAGSSRLSGTAATGYLRPGDPKADVTGAEVAERAQLLLTSTLRAAMSRHTLLNTVTLTRFLTRASGALTVDDGTTLGDLRSLATSLGQLSGSAVQRASLPVAQEGYQPAGTKQDYVLLDRTATRNLFDSVIAHTRIPADLGPGAAPSNAVEGAGEGAGDAAPSPAPAPEAQSPAAPAQGPTVPPNQVSVDVLNGTGVTGLAGTVADALRGQGFVVGSVGNEPGAVTQTLVRYGPGAAEQARTVAAAVPGSVLQADDSLGNGVQLVIGPGYSNVVPVQLATAAPASASAAAPTTPPKPVTC